MTRIVIAGAGGFGRGVHSWIATSPRHLAEYDIDEIVYIDDSQPDMTHAKLVSTVSDYAPSIGDRVLCAIGSPATRQRVVEQLSNREVVFHTFIDDRAVLGNGAIVGKGAVICPGVTVSADAKVLDHSHINFGCAVGHDTQLGEFSTLSPMVNIMGEVVVGRKVFLGGSAVVLPRISIGDGCTIGAGAVVVRSTPANATMVGNPAQHTSGF